MSKMKTHSGAKKRLKISASGKLIGSQAGKQHFMRRRSNGKIRDLRGTTVLAEADAKRVIKNFLPNG